MVKFKKELVRQFYAMRRFLIEKQPKLWSDTRIASKETGEHPFGPAVW